MVLTWGCMSASTAVHVFLIMQLYWPRDVLPAAAAPITLPPVTHRGLAGPAGLGNHPLSAAKLLLSSHHPPSYTEVGCIVHTCASQTRVPCPDVGAATGGPHGFQIRSCRRVGMPARGSKLERALAIYDIN